MAEEEGEWVMYDYYQWLYLQDVNSTNITFIPLGSPGDDRIPWLEFLWIAIIYSLVFLLGVIGNSLVIYCVAKYKRMKSITNQLLMSLASADLLLILICVPIKVS